MVSHSDTGAVFITGGYSNAAVCAAPEAANGSVAMEDVAEHRRLMYQCAYMHDAFEFDCVSLSWRQLRRADARPVLSSARSAGAAVERDGALHVFGGCLGMLHHELTPGDCNSVRWRCCARCGVAEGELSVCGGCAAAGCAPVFYCSRACQGADWPTHRLHCSGSSSPHA